MVIFPNAKINLGLNILRKRSDGYHDLETLFYPLPFYDALESTQETGIKNTSINTTGISVSIPENENLCFLAWELLKKDFPILPIVNIHLHKSIPTGAGLGGGSADAAFMLKLLNKQFNLELDQDRLLKYALQLGSDCPFFILNTPCIASGRGEDLKPVKLSLAGYKLILVNPGIHISTREAFGSIKPENPLLSIEEIITSPIEKWKDQLQNDFEPCIFATHHPLAEIKDELYHQGALYASMSGTGSSIYGIFKSTTQATLNFPNHYSVVELILN